METQITQTENPVSNNTSLAKLAYEDAFIRLVSRHEFYAHILMQLKVSFVNNPNWTLGVCIRGSNVHLRVGTEFFLKSSDDQRVFYLMHEMAHPMLGHLCLERQQNPEDHKILNIAMDVAIHEILTQAKTLFPDGKPIKPCTVEGLRKLCSDDTIKNNETTEYYFNFLKKTKEEIGEKLKDFKFDDHDFQEGEGSFDIDVAKAITVGLLEKAKRSCGAGNTPMDAELTIEKCKKSVKNWRGILRRFVASNTSDNIRMTRNKRNKRYGFVVPGKKRTFEPKIVCIIDTSGSMGMDQLSSVVAELSKMKKQGYDIWTIEADAIAHKPKEFSDKGDIKLRGGGGTKYQPAFDMAATLSPDVVIYLTDLDPSDIPNRPKYPVLWADVSCGRGAFKPSFGTIIYIEEK